MARIAFLLVPELGHLNSSWKLAKSLRARGHEICYLGIPDHAAHIAKQQFQFVPLLLELTPHGLTHLHDAHSDDEPSIAIAKLLTERLAGGLRAKAFLHAEIKGSLQRLNPDLLIVDALLPDFIGLAQAVGLPCVTLNGTMFKDDKFVSAFPSFATVPEMVLCPPEFEFSLVDKPSRRRFYVEAGIDLHRPEPAFPWTRLIPGKKLLYCAIGSQPQLFACFQKLFQAVFEAAAALSEWQLVAATGPDFPLDSFRGLPEDAILAPVTPQLKLLERAEVMITHGGFNSVKESIYSGVPMIVVPVFRDHPMIAARIVHHGLGCRVDASAISGTSLARMVRKMSGDDVMKARVQAMSSKFREIERAEPSRHLIEALLSRRSRAQADESNAVGN